MLLPIVPSGLVTSYPHIFRRTDCLARWVARRPRNEARTNRWKSTGGQTDLSVRRVDRETRPARTRVAARVCAWRRRSRSAGRFTPHGPRAGAWTWGALMPVTPTPTRQVTPTRQATPTRQVTPRRPTATPVTRMDNRVMRAWMRALRHRCPRELTPSGPSTMTGIIEVVPFTQALTINGSMDSTLMGFLDLFRAGQPEVGTGRGSARPRDPARRLRRTWGRPHCSERCDHGGQRGRRRRLFPPPAWRSDGERWAPMDSFFSYLQARADQRGSRGNRATGI